MKRIFKYDVPLSDKVTIPMPDGAKILHVAEQGYEIRLWALVDPTRPPVKRRFSVVGTGHAFDASSVEHLGTVMSSNGLVWHVFEASGETTFRDSLADVPTHPQPGVLP